MIENNYYILEKSFFDKTLNMKFGNKKYAIPSNYDIILTKVYGDYMKLPPENERIGHGDIILSFTKSFEELQSDK